jgi:peroxiredoxin
MTVDIGAQAPDFTLPNQDRQAVHLRDELGKGNVVLAFFPAAFSSVCTTELCSFRDQLGPLSHLSKAQVFGISVDTPFALKAFATEQRLNFPLLSDFNKEVIRAYDVFNPEMIGLKGIAKRAVFVIDRDGTIRHKEVLEDARNEPNYDRLNGALASL